MDEPLSSSDKQLTAERLKAFQDALEVLYIPSNMGGRLRFAEGWAPAAQYIFGDELSRYDREGTRDRARREQLEDEAEARRAALVETVEDLEKNSSERGVLQTEYVQGVIRNLGRETALYLYAPWLVDKFAPGGNAPVAQAPVHKHETISQDPSAYDLAEGAISSELVHASAPPPVVERFEDEEEKQEIAAPEIHPIDTDTIKPISIESAPVAEPEPVREILPINIEPVKEEPPAAPPKRKTLKIFGIKDGTDKDGAGS